MLPKKKRGFKIEKRDLTDIKTRWRRFDRERFDQPWRIVKHECKLKQLEYQNGDRRIHL